jgi:hypothetical protein
LLLRPLGPLEIEGFEGIFERIGDGVGAFFEALVDQGVVPVPSDIPTNVAPTPTFNPTPTDDLLP